MKQLTRRTVLGLAAAAATLLLPAVATAQSTPKHKAVFQVSDADPGKWNLALNNAANVVQELGRDNVDLEIVVYGPGIGMLKADSPVAGRVNAALQGGIQVVACENTLKAMKLTHADMMTTIGYVPAGVVELMKRQREGYAYIRP